MRSSHDYDEAARNYYALYSVAPADDAVAENALASLARMILTAPEQAIHFGSGNLSLYRDVATMDPHPGFLNGVVSLLLNNSDPAESRRRSRSRMPRRISGVRARRSWWRCSNRDFRIRPQRADLRERVIEAYAIYGSNDGVIRAGTKFLTDFPDAPNRTAVAMRMADAYARTNQTQQEFAIYDCSLLAGAGASARMACRSARFRSRRLPSALKWQQAGASTRRVRSPEYARVLDRYVARLVSLKRVRDALALYRREIDRNPNDPGLYDTLAAFLDQNRLGAEMEQTYQRAIAQFPDHTWEHKLARWYLRQRRQADVTRITRDVVKIFSGTELDGYFQEIVHPTAPVGSGAVSAIECVRASAVPASSELRAESAGCVSTTATRDDVAYEALLREHWYRRRRSADAILRAAVAHRASGRGVDGGPHGECRCEHAGKWDASWRIRIPRRCGCWRKAKRGADISKPPRRCFSRSRLISGGHRDWPTHGRQCTDRSAIYRSLRTARPKMTIRRSQLVRN